MGSALASRPADCPRGSRGDLRLNLARGGTRRPPPPPPPDLRSSCKSTWIFPFSYFSFCSGFLKHLFFLRCLHERSARTYTYIDRLGKPSFAEELFLLDPGGHAFPITLMALLTRL